MVLVRVPRAAVVGEEAGQVVDHDEVGQLARRQDVHDAHQFAQLEVRGEVLHGDAVRGVQVRDALREERRRRLDRVPAANEQHARVRVALHERQRVLKQERGLPRAFRPEKEAVASALDGRRGWVHVVHLEEVHRRPRAAAERAVHRPRHGPDARGGVKESSRAPVQISLLFRTGCEKLSFLCASEKTTAVFKSRPRGDTSGRPRPYCGGSRASQGEHASLVVPKHAPRRHSAARTGVPGPGPP